MEFKKIMIAIDGSPISFQGAEVGIALGRQLKAEICFVHVVDTRLMAVPETGFSVGSIRESLIKSGRELLDHSIKRVSSDLSQPWTILKEGIPGEDIVASAKEWAADLLVIATHGRSGLSRFLMGSTAETVLRHAPCPVLAVKAKTTTGS